MKNNIIYPIIVEGLSDKNKILSLFNAQILTTKGNDIDLGVLKLLKEKDIKVLLLLDPDNQGKIIRENIKKYINNTVDIEIKFCPNKKKPGVAEASIEEIKSALTRYSSNEEIIRTIDKNSFRKVGLVEDKFSKDKQIRLCKKLGIKYYSSKELISILNILKYSEDELINLCK